MKNFDVIGNNTIKEYLKQSIDNDKYVHSYIFSGTNGIGKLQLAKQFAKKILCLNKQEDCSCKSCKCIENDNHTDFCIINEAGETIKIDDIRNIISKVYEYPITSSKKVYIINDCEKMTIEAQNCLLKTLEEPPQFVVIILVTSNIELLLQTIKSRCMILKFENLSDNDIKQYLNDNFNDCKINATMIKFINGSIGRAFLGINYIEKFNNIDVLVQKIKTSDIVELFTLSHEVLDKENINILLEYMVVCVYEKGKEDSRYFNCVNIINQYRERLKRNCNFDMCIDKIIMDMWKEFR